MNHYKEITISSHNCPPLREESIYIYIYVGSYIHYTYAY